MARQRLGQHFLGDTGWHKRILETLPLKAGQTWIEVGPGHGEMTRHLVGDGRRVVAIDADAVLAEGLRAAAAESPETWPRLEVVTSDVLQYDIGAITPDRFHVYGNLPYYITSPILQHLFQWADRIESIHIVIQLEVAERIAAKPGSRDYGYLSTLCQYFANPRLAFRIPPGAFRPPPKVQSALVEFEFPGAREKLKRTEVDEPKFLEFLQACFAHKRKTLRNNLRESASDEQIHKALESAGARQDARAEQLTLEQFARIFGELR